MSVKIIAAVGKNGELGKNGGLCFQIHDDMKFFRETTSGHKVLMGYRTWESIGKALPNRVNYVATFVPEEMPDGVIDTNEPEKLLQEYKNESFYNENGSMNLRTNVDRITSYCQSRGALLNGQFQIVDGFALFPVEYFCPIDFKTGKITITDKTHAIHHFDGSWFSEKEHYMTNLRWRLCKFFPRVVSTKVSHLITNIKFFCKR